MATCGTARPKGRWHTARQRPQCCPLLRQRTAAPQLKPPGTTSHAPLPGSLMEHGTSTSLICPTPHARTSSPVGPLLEPAHPPVLRQLLAARHHLHDPGGCSPRPPAPPLRHAVHTQRSAAPLRRMRCRQAGAAGCAQHLGGPLPLRCPVACIFLLGGPERCAATSSLVTTSTAGPAQDCQGRHRAGRHAGAPGGAQLRRLPWVGGWVLGCLGSKSCLTATKRATQTSVLGCEGRGGAGNWGSGSGAQKGVCVARRTLRGTTSLPLLSTIELPGGGRGRGCARVLSSEPGS